MTNRTLVILSCLVILGMIVLLGLNLIPVLTGEPGNERYLQYNGVRGIAVKHKDLLYTLNFRQQNQVIDMLNHAVHVVSLPPEAAKKFEIDNIVIYQFDSKPDIILYPVAYSEKNIFFSVPRWDSRHYFMDLSEGDLYNLLAQTYDP